MIEEKIEHFFEEIVSHVQNNGKDFNSIISELNHILNKTDPDIINRRKAAYKNVQRRYPILGSLLIRYAKKKKFLFSNQQERTKTLFYNGLMMKFVYFLYLLMLDWKKIVINLSWNLCKYCGFVTIFSLIFCLIQIPGSFHSQITIAEIILLSLRPLFI